MPGVSQILRFPMGANPGSPDAFGPGTVSMTHHVPSRPSVPIAWPKQVLKTGRVQEAQGPCL